MPNAEFQDKSLGLLSETMPLTNLTTYPRTQVKLVLKEPLRVGDVPHGSTESEEEEEEDIGSRDAVQPSRPTRDGKDSEEGEEEVDDAASEEEEELDEESDE